MERLLIQQKSLTLQVNLLFQMFLYEVGEDKGL